MNKAIKVLIPCLFAVAVGGSTLAAHMIHAPETPQQTVKTAPAPVNSYVSCLGRLEPLGEVINVGVPATMASERIGELYIKEGERVKAGQLIAEMESSKQAKADLKEAVERVGVADAQLKRVLAGAKVGELNAQKETISRLTLELAGKTSELNEAVERAQSQVEFDKNEHARYQALVGQGAVTMSQYDGKRLALESSTCRLKEALADKTRTLDTLSAQIREAKSTYEKIAEIRPCDVTYAQAELNAAKAHAEKVQQDYELSLVRAPIDGQIIKIVTKKGESATDKTIIEMGETGSMVAVAEVYESDIHNVKNGDIATISGSALTKPVTGKVYSVGHKLIKQKVFSSQPGENFDDRVIETKILIYKNRNLIIYIFI